MANQSVQEIFNKLYNDSSVHSVEAILNAVYDRGFRPANTITVGLTGCDHTSVADANTAAAANYATTGIEQIIEVNPGATWDLDGEPSPGVIIREVSDKINRPVIGSGVRASEAGRHDYVRSVPYALPMVAIHCDDITADITTAVSGGFAGTGGFAGYCMLNGVPVTHGAVCSYIDDAGHAHLTASELKALYMMTGAEIACQSYDHKSDYATFEAWLADMDKQMLESRDILEQLDAAFPAQGFWDTWDQLTADQRAEVKSIGAPITGFSTPGQTVMANLGSRLEHMQGRFGSRLAAIYDYAQSYYGHVLSKGHPFGQMRYGCQLMNIASADIHTEIDPAGDGSKCYFAPNVRYRFNFDSSSLSHATQKGYLKANMDALVRLRNAGKIMLVTERTLFSAIAPGYSGTAYTWGGMPQFTDLPIAALPNGTQVQTLIKGWWASSGTCAIVDDTGNALSVAAASTAKVDLGLDPGSHCFRIQAKNAVGGSNAALTVKLTWYEVTASGVSERTIWYPAKTLTDAYQYYYFTLGVPDWAYRVAIQLSVATNGAYFKDPGYSIG